MSSEVIASLVVAAVAGAWRVYSTFDDRSTFLNEKKAEYYQRVIAAEEELHEAYFNGVPDDASRQQHKGWRLEKEGWMRTKNWNKTDRYVSAATDMNWCLAGIALFAPVKIASKCSALEDIATYPIRDEDRKIKLDELINLMREDLKSVKKGEKFSDEWN